MKSIGIRLTSIMLAVLLFGIAVTVGIAVSISGNMLVRESLSKMNKSTLYEAKRMDEWLSVRAGVIDGTANTLAGMDNLAAILTSQSGTGTFEDQTEDILRGSLKRVMDNTEDFFEIYMGFADGTAVTGSGYQFDYTGANGPAWSAPERGWYKLALTDTSSVHITAPYVDAQTNDLCISAVRAIVHEGTLIGVLGADIFVTELQNITLSATLDATGYSMLTDKNGDIFIHPDAAYAPDDKGDLRNMSTVKNGAHAEMWRTVSAKPDVYKFPRADSIEHYYNAIPLSSTGWYFISALPAKTVTQPTQNIIILIIVIAVVILLLASLLVYLTVRNIISKPLVTLSTFMKKAGTTGDITLSQSDVEIIGVFAKARDEIGETISNSAAFVGHITNVAAELERISNGDLRSEVKLLSEADTIGLSLRKTLENLNNMFAEINKSTTQVSSGSKQIAGGAQTLAQGSTEQAASVEQLSSSISDIANKTKENADKAVHAANLANTIKDNAEKGSRQMDEMMSAVKDINAASQSISKVIKVIDDIAFQTNILALNAAVEAARAGQHGKGFAVVAEEVRSLASKSAEAARDTGGLIANSMEKAELGSRIAHETSTSLTEIVTGINESAKIVTEISHSSEEQSLEIRQINQGIDQVAQVVQQNSATAEESAASAEEMSGQSELLQDLILRFKLRDENTLSSGSSNKRFAMPDRSDNSDSFGKY
ncbi:MAG: methyl-accepting chemotaxis protein [Oscillospiraceae bacterium]|nr:methyl-accepting chemotaxis protein [Oscillospiraceae bacterium]